MRTVWPGGRLARRASLRSGSSSENTSSSSSPAAPGESVITWWRGRRGPAPVTAARPGRRGSGREATDAQVHVVAVRAHGGHAAAEVVGARRPAPPARPAARPVGQVGGGHLGGPVGHARRRWRRAPGPGGRAGLARLGAARPPPRAGVPHVEGEGGVSSSRPPSLEQGVALLEDLVDLAAQGVVAGVRGRRGRRPGSAGAPPVHPSRARGRRRKLRHPRVHAQRPADRVRG